jgi:heptose-I-phosphate ethanolaminephosphotransferase
MSGYLENSGNPTNWYEHLTIIEIMQKAGYETYWISNQSKTGIYENEVGRYADLCDSQSFVGNMHSGTKRSDLDEFLLPLIEESMEKSSNKKFFIIQMQGSHRDYRLRYSPEYAKFGVEDYATTHSRLSLKNREVVARYDNSILYNDYVVTEIMKLFKEEDAVVLYLSDHGQDVFDTSDDFFGHSTEHGYDIPMMFYPTPVFCEKHGELVNSIKSTTEKEFRTDSLMYTIMDIAGVETVNGISYKQKSLLK